MGRKGRDAVMRMAIANRRKQLAQAIWLRQRIDAHLEAGEPLIVLGDLNDGPGLDEYEHLFGRSSVEIILGEGAEGAIPLYDPHAQRALNRRIGAINDHRAVLSAPRKTLSAGAAGLRDDVARSDGQEPALADHGIRLMTLNAGNCPSCRDALLTASDHFPVTLGS